MSARVAVGLLFILALAIPAVADEKSDQKKIQGKWKIESATQGGKAMPEEMIKTATMLVEGNKMTVTMTFNGKEDSAEMTFRLDPSKKPAAIDVDIKGMAGTGIYKLEIDKLTVCHGDSGDPRPTEFASKDGSKTALIVFKRAK